MPDAPPEHPAPSAESEPPVKKARADISTFFAKLGKVPGSIVEDMVTNQPEKPPSPQVDPSFDLWRILLSQLPEYCMCSVITGGLIERKTLIPVFMPKDVTLRVCRFCREAQGLYYPYYERTPLDVYAIKLKLN